MDTKVPQSCAHKKDRGSHRLKSYKNSQNIAVTHALSTHKQHTLCITIFHFNHCISTCSKWIAICSLLNWSPSWSAATVSPLEWPALPLCTSSTAQIASNCPSAST